jgi:hypothetical protein
VLSSMRMPDAVGACVVSDKKTKYIYIYIYIYIYDFKRRRKRRGQLFCFVFFFLGIGILPKSQFRHTYFYASDRVGK